MAERASINQSVQLGVEATPGTAVAATRRLGSIGFAISPQAEIASRRPIGQKYSSLHVLGQEWAEAELEGGPVYTEMPYIFSSLLSAGTVTQLTDAATPTGAYRWVFDSNSFGDDAPKTFTVEQGSAVRAHRVTNAIISELSFEWSREEIELGGTALARAIEDGIALSPGATMLEQVPVKPTDLSIYLDGSSANLGTTKLLRNLSGEFSMSDRYTPLWVVDRDQPSFVTTIEGEPDVTFTLTMEADAQGMGPLTAMRAGQTRFLRIEAVGPVIYNAATPIRHTMILDIAGQVSEPQEFSDEDGVYAIGWEFGAVHDATWGRAIRAEVITTLAAL
jgi:hypothetical protein